MKMNVAIVFEYIHPSQSLFLVRWEATVETHLKIPKCCKFFQQLFVVGQSAVRLQCCQTVESFIAR